MELRLGIRRKTAASLAVGACFCLLMADAAFAGGGSGTEDSGGPIGSVLLDLLVLLVAAKLAAEVAERLRQPAVLGELVAGVLLGPSVLGLVGRT